MQLECRRDCQLVYLGNESVGIVKHGESQTEGCMRVWGVMRNGEGQK